MEMVTPFHFVSRAKTAPMLAMRTTDSLDFGTMSTVNTYANKLFIGLVYLFINLAFYKSVTLVAVDSYLSYLSIFIIVRVFIFILFPQRNIVCPVHVIKYVFLYIGKFHQESICPFCSFNVYVCTYCVSVQLYHTGNPDFTSIGMLGIAIKSYSF